MIKQETIKMKKSQFNNLVLEAYSEVLSELREAPDHLYYFKIEKIDKASQNAAQDVIETWYSPAKIVDIVDDDGAGNVIMYIKKEDFDPGMMDDLKGNGVQIVDTNMPDETDDYGRPVVDPKGSRTFLEPDEMLPHNRFKDLMKESLLDELSEEEEEEPTPEEEPDPDADEETVLEDATDTILAKFPTLAQAIIKLQTEDFKEFVDTVDWISPRPTSFRVNLKNGQDYILKWTGKTFEAQIMGKRYLLSKINEYQQALDKLALLYRESPMKGAGEEGGDFDADTGGGGGGGGEFPGDDAAGGGEEGEDFAADDTGGGEEEGGEDLSDEPIDFESGEEG